jgi:hypothetical protein
MNIEAPYFIWGIWGFIMKKLSFMGYKFRIPSLLVIILLIFINAESLFAQKFRDAKIYVTPVIGIGRLGDNIYFYKQIASEVVGQYHTLVRTLRGSDYVLRSEIEPYTGISKISPDEELPDVSAFIRIMGRMEFFAVEGQDDAYFRRIGDVPRASGGPESEGDLTEEDVNAASSGEFLFYLELLDSRTGKILAQQEMIYSSIDDSVNQMLSIIVYNMIAGIPDIMEYEDWRDKWFYAGASFFWTPRIYDYNDEGNEGQSAGFLNVGGGISLEAHFLPFLTAGFGFEFTRDLVVVAGEPNMEYSDTILEMPLYLKLVFKPLEQYVIEPYGGVTYNFSLKGVTEPFTISWMAGVQFGFRAGPGMVTLTSRFTMDMDYSGIAATESEYMRTILHIGAGYKIGFVQKRLPSAPFTGRRKVAE